MALLTVLAVSFGGCGGPGGGTGNRGGNQGINGGGSSFINPIMKVWAGKYLKETGTQVDYTSSGSGNGIRQMMDKKNDFGGTDAPMNTEQLEAAGKIGGDVLHIPLVMGAVVPAYNLPDLKAPLKFTGPVLADIFLGNIKKWNDGAIKKLNPMAELPDMDIAVVHRSDGSGTTYIWSYYLSKVSPEWKTKVNFGTDLKWPVGIGAQKNDGVAGQISRTPGAIGYVELIYALKDSKLQYGSVRNHMKEDVRASLESVTKAAEGELSDNPVDLLNQLTDSPAKGAYPICGATWAVLYENQPEGKAKLLKEFLNWCIHEGQNSTQALQYARLPDGLVKRVEKMLNRIQAAK
jgi:phosphate transport system substrate-binding protein